MQNDTATPAQILVAQGAATVAFALETIGLPAGVTTNVTACSCGELACFFCAATFEAAEEAELEERYGGGWYVVRD